MLILAGGAIEAQTILLPPPLLLSTWQALAAPGMLAQSGAEKAERGERVMRKKQACNGFTTALNFWFIMGAF